MAASASSGRVYSVGDVVAELMGSDLDHEEFSDDDFEGYVDDENEEFNQEADVSVADLDIGTECEIGESDPALEIRRCSLSPGCTTPCSHATPLELFKILMTESILDKIVEQTNLYTNQFSSGHNLPPWSRVHSWSKQQFTREEFHKFLSLVIVMGLVNLPTLEHHWSTMWPYSSLACSK